MTKADERLPGRLSRTVKAAALGGRVTGSYLGGKIADRFRSRGGRQRAELGRHVANVQRMVETMRELRGPLMKIGQLLSTHTEALPGPYGELLRSLQQSAPPMRYETIARVIAEDLGAPPEDLFQHLSREAVAAASLGQVHKGRLPDGTVVAVKVQYPGAEASVAGDMSNLKLGAGFMKKMIADVLGNERLDLTPIADELAEHLTQETDYCREAYNAKLLAQLFDGDPEIVVPRVHDSHSGLRVITYDYVEGRSLDWGLRHHDRDRRERTVRQLVHAFWRQLFQGGLLHADPHPGNYVILDDGRLALLDYGCVKVFDEHFLREFGEMVLARMTNDEGRMVQSMIALDLIADPNDESDIEDMRRIASYFSAGLDGDIFDFVTFDYVRNARELVRHFLSRRRIPPAQRDFLFLTRVVLGYYEYFSRAALPLDYRTMVQPYVERGWAGRAVAIPPYTA